MADTLSPLQAAARAITAKDKWGEDAIGCGARNSDCRSGACLDCSRLIARAALLAAIEALPEDVDAEDPERDWANIDGLSCRKSALRTAFGLGDQPNG